MSEKHMEEKFNCAFNACRLQVTQHCSLNKHTSAHTRTQNPSQKPGLTIVLLKAIFTNFNLILGLKHTLKRCTQVHSTRPTLCSMEG